MTTASTRSTSPSTRQRAGVGGGVRTTQRLAGHTDSVTAAAFGGGGTVLATGGEDGAVLLHDLRSPSLPTILLPAGPDAVASLAWQQPDAGTPGDGVLAVGVGRSIALVDARRAVEAAAASALTAADEIACVAFAGDATTLAAVDDTGAAVVGTVAGDALRVSARLRSAHDSLAAAAAWRPGSARHLVTGGFDCTVALWDVEAGRCAARWRAGAAAVGAADAGGQMFNPPFVHAVATPPPTTTGTSAFLVAAAAGDGSVLLLDGRAAPAARRGGRAAGSAAPPLAVLTGEANGHRAAATALAFIDAGGGDGRLLASGGNDGRVLVWDWRAAAARGGPPSAAWRDAVGGGAAAPVLTADVDHGSKVQALAAGPHGRLAVCDMGSVVAVVTVR